MNTGELLNRMLRLIRCAQADLEGIMPEFEPSGDRKHSGWVTLRDLALFLEEFERYEIAMRACEELVGAYDAGGERGGSVDWEDVNAAYVIALAALGKEHKDAAEGDVPAGPPP